jgi:Nucleotidyltransferase
MFMQALLMPVTVQTTRAHGSYSQRLNLHVTEPQSALSGIIFIKGKGPIPLPALQGTAGEPLRFLDCLIYQQYRGIVLHGLGIAVNVPQPARFAIHKLVIAGMRLTDAAG